MDKPPKTLNEVFSSLSTRRRYEVWFLRVGLAEGGGAWWFRYLLMNPGRRGCVGYPQGMPVQVWATWFQPGLTPQTFIQGFPLEELELSPRGGKPFHFRICKNAIEENCCQGALEVSGRTIAWNLHYSSAFQVTMSDKGWIGFSRTPHSDALFSGQITFDGTTFKGDPVGFGVQGHNCGYRHRTWWNWAHAYFPRPGRPASTFEALVYDMPFGLVFRKAVLWHEGQMHVFRNLRTIQRDRDALRWNFRCCTKDGLQLDAILDGTGPGRHSLPYLKTDCSGSLEVVNNSLATALVRIERPGELIDTLETSTGAVLEMAGAQLNSPHSQD